MVNSTDLDADSRRRQRWLSVLANSPWSRLEALWREIERELPVARSLRRPEIGLVMVQGRISGTGSAFCAGEMTATRAAVRLDSGEVGIGYVGGRSTCHAEIVATIDAVGQRAEWRDILERRIVAPLAEEAEVRRRLAAARANATKVEFFTVAREAGA